MAALFDDDAAQRPRGLRVTGKPLIRPDDDGVRVRSAAVQVLACRVQPADNPAGDFDAAPGPHVLQALKVAVHESTQQGRRGRVETGDRGAQQLVGERGAMHRLLPGGLLDGRLGAGGEGGGMPGFAGGGVVPGQFAVELLGGGLPVGGQGVPEVPPELRIHGQAVNHGAAVQDAAEQVQPAAVVAAGRGDRACPCQLLVGARRGPLQLIGCQGQEAVADRVPPGRGHVAFDRRGRVAQDVQQHADAGLRGAEALHGVHVEGRRRDGVTGRIPERGPAQGPGHRIRERAERGPDGGFGARVQPDLGVAEVIVVDQQQGRPRLAGQGRHLGPGAADVGLDAVRADQGAGVVHLVQADPQPVRPRLLPARRRVLGVLVEGHGAEDAVVLLDPGGEGRDSGGLQPLAGPVREVPAGGGAERGQQVSQGGVAVGVVLEVLARTGDEGLETHIGDELLEHRGALGVRDAVEVLLCCLKIGDVGDDRVRRGQLVLHVGPGLAVVREVHPGRGPVRGAVHAEGPHVVREGLLEPQVVPPLHRDEVAEPHVGHLVQQGVGAGLVLRIGRPGGEDVVLREGHQSGVLHGAEVVLGHEGLVVLAPRVREVEELVEEVQAVFGEGEECLGVEGRRHRRAAVEGQGHLQAAAVRRGSRARNPRP